MNKALWKRLYEINKIKTTLKKLHERGLIFSEKKFIVEIMKDVQVSERTAKEYLREALLNPLETKENASEGAVNRRFEEQSQL